MRGDITPAFIDGCRGRLFMLQRRPPGERTAPCVMIVPPFAEEMNKCRPSLCKVAQGLAGRGIATLMPDLTGTGDSEGGFRDADWGAWKDDLARAARWSRECGYEVTGLICVRLGCVLGAQVAASMPLFVARTVFWQPVLDGARFLGQFLRLRAAASAMEDIRETVAELRTRLDAEEMLEVAGYELSATLAGQIEQVRLVDALGPHLGQLQWIETVRAADDPMPEASARAIRDAIAAGNGVTAGTIAGAPYWSSVEIVRTPGLVDRTIAAFAEAV